MTGSMSGLTVRWSLVGAPPEVAARLEEYVAGTSHARFEQLPGLRFKTWRMRPGEWFEGCYVFTDEAARQAFQDDFAQGAAQAPGSQIVGAPPISIEECQVVAIAQGPDGLVSAPSYERSQDPR